MVCIELRTGSPCEFLSITDRVQQAVKESGVQNGLCCVYVSHTTAAVTVNENADPAVVHDILYALDRIVPLKDSGYRHAEGNSAAHLKACLFGASQTVPVRGGLLALGVWQGIYFCEFDGPRTRHVYVKTVPG